MIKTILLGTLLSGSSLVLAETAKIEAKAEVTPIKSTNLQECTALLQKIKVGTKVEAAKAYEGAEKREVAKQIIYLVKPDGASMSVSFDRKGEYLESSLTLLKPTFSYEEAIDLLEKSYGIKLKKAHEEVTEDGGFTIHKFKDEKRILSVRSVKSEGHHMITFSLRRVWWK